MTISGRRAMISAAVTMRAFADSGHAILVVSSELPELIGISDRVLAMHEGRIVGELPRGASEEEVMRLSVGLQQQRQHTASERSA